ncbi:DUF6011 domain-containing protein [Streptomyces sp. NPDC094153]|uniref:DUF6011 domain-containing protein n=1 Tax=Streptomyces sp. NPDC094153 TaxID=3366058 RepID=UPI003826C3CF
METRAADEEPFHCLGGCGRTLISPVSRAQGYGPVCWRKLHGRPPRTPRTTRPSAATPGPGQAELPADDQLELPWSP